LKKISLFIPLNNSVLWFQYFRKDRISALNFAIEKIEEDLKKIKALFIGNTEMMKT